jgi:enamine deaminase RidA (YjgF/YER057c/UK114 family)
MTSTRNLVSLAVWVLCGCTAHASIETGRSDPDKIVFTGTGEGPISSGVVVPANRAYYWTSGVAPSVLNASAPAGSRERYGDTKTQAIGILRAIEAQLHERGLSLSDVVYMRVYVAPDKFKNNTYDFPGWFEAYGQFFNNASNPVRVARSSIGVAQLVNPDWLIEIEAAAVYR